MADVPGKVVLSAVLVVLLASLGPASSQSDVCASPFNRDVYKNDVNVASHGWNNTCGVDSRFCNCSTQTWVVRPYQVLTDGNGNPTSRYLDAASGSKQLTQPWILGVYSRGGCCSACSSWNRQNRTDGTSSAYWNAIKDGSGAYASNGTKVFQCKMWLHYIPQGSTTARGGCDSNLGGSNNTADGCGYCIIYPPGADDPLCSTGTTCTQGKGAEPSPAGYITANYVSAGKGCAGGTNDPHFVGAHGTHFDFNGVPDQSFCLVTDKTFQVNMKMRGYYDSRTVGASILKNGKAVRTWIRDLGVIWIDPKTGLTHTLRMWARDGKSQHRDDGFLGGLEVDGDLSPRLSVGQGKALEGGLSVSFLNYEKAGGGFFDVDVYEVSIAGMLTMSVKLRVAHPLLQTPEDAMAHINVRLDSIEHSPSIHGILGQTFRAGREKRALEYTSLSLLMHRDVAVDSASGAGFIDGNVGDYRTASVISPACKYSAFDRKELSIP